MTEEAPFVAIPPPQAVVPAHPVNPPRQLIVNYVATEVSDEELFQIFSQCGTVDSARVICDRTTGLTKGFAFVYYKSHEEALHAVDLLQGFHLYGKRLKCSFALNQRVRGEGSTTSFTQSNSRLGDSTEGVSMMSSTSSVQRGT